MKHSIGTKVLGCTVGASMVLGGAVAMGPAMALALDNLNPAKAIQRDAVDYDKIANISGSFSFCQDELTPADDVFNLFGTAATTICAKPGFAFDSVTHESYYVNVGGNVEKVYTIGLDEIEQMDAQIQEMRCTCGMSPALAMASVKGVKVSDMLSMADVDSSANTITFKDQDGYGLPMPLSYVMEKEALLVYQVGDKKLSEGERLQVWIPDTVAKYFTRAVTDIELSVSEEAPKVEGPDWDRRAKVNVLNTVQDVFKVGDMISFEGYADDCGTQIAAVEFSLDGGNTWTSFDTSASNTESWVYWHFDYVTEKAGNFKLDVRAVTEDGVVSPLASSVVLNVEE
ncbi:MAG: molybdopterin-dependent oxidoreductase [Clostridia bacterium]